MAQGEGRGRSCLFGCGTALLLFPLTATALFLLTTLMWKLQLRDFEHEYEEVSLLLLLLGACTGLGGGVLVYALTRSKKTEE